MKIRRGHGVTSGFTLLEVLVIMLVLCVLAALTLPSFQRLMVRGKRLEAQSALMRLMQQQERYYSQNNSYLAFSSASTDARERRFTWWSGQTAASSAYEIHGTACADAKISDCVLLIAEPGTSRVDGRFRDRECETLSLSSSGVQAASGAAARCWP